MARINRGSTTIKLEGFRGVTMRAHMCVDSQAHVRPKHMCVLVQAHA